MEVRGARPHDRDMSSHRSTPRHSNFSRRMCASIALSASIAPLLGGAFAHAASAQAAGGVGAGQHCSTIAAREFDFAHVAVGLPTYNGALPLSRADLSWTFDVTAVMSIENLNPGHRVATFDWGADATFTLGSLPAMHLAPQRSETFDLGPYDGINDGGGTSGATVNHTDPPAATATSSTTITGNDLAGWTGSGLVSGFLDGTGDTSTTTGGNTEVSVSTLGEATVCVTYVVAATTTSTTTTASPTTAAAPTTSAAPTRVADVVATRPVAAAPMALAFTGSSGWLASAGVVVTLIGIVTMSLARRLRR